MIKIYGKLLIDDYPIQVLPTLAKQIGLNEAIFLQQLHYWLNGKGSKKIDGRQWIYNTYTNWQKQFPFWSVRTIKRIVDNLEEKKLIIKGNYNKKTYDKTIWYSINYDEIENIESLLRDKTTRQTVTTDSDKMALGANDKMSQGDRTDWHDGEGQNGTTNTIDYTETTTETNKRKSPQSKKRYGDDSPYLKLAHQLFDYIKQRNPEHKEPNWQTWADDFRKAAELDKRSLKNLKDVIDWSQQDDFWQNNILSAAKLRKQYDKLRIQMNNTNNNKVKGAYTTDEYDGFF